MSEKKLFSLWILTYKNFDGIYMTLDSVFQQDYPNIELIISDDGSLNYDKEIEKIKKYIDTNKRENIVSVVYSHLEQNQGTVCNQNNALTLAKGEYVKGFACDDTLSCSSALSQYVKFLESNEYDIVFSKLEGRTEDGRRVRYLASCEDDYTKLRKLTPAQLCNRLYARNFLPAPAWCAKKKIFIENGKYSGHTKFIEDYPYWIHLCRNNVKFGFMDEVLVYYTLNGISSSGSYSEAFMKDMFEIYNKNIFPYDTRFGILQPIYNFLKKEGLNAYYAKAKWNSYSKKEKLYAYARYGLFFTYINIEKTKYQLINTLYN